MSLKMRSAQAPYGTQAIMKKFFIQFNLCHIFDYFSIATKYEQNVNEI